MCVHVGAENEHLIADNLKLEKENSESLTLQIDALKSAHKEEMDHYQLQVLVDAWMWCRFNILTMPRMYMRSGMVSAFDWQFS